MKHLLNIFCGLMLLFPFAANCQTDLKDIDPRDIKVEISKYGDTTRYYYDENDNKILHGKQVSRNTDCLFGKATYIYTSYRNYNHGVLDGNVEDLRFYRDPFVKSDEWKLVGQKKGSYTNGKVDGHWEKYSYSDKDQKLVLNRWEDWVNGTLFGFYNGKANINFSFLPDSMSAMISSGEFFLEGKLLKVNKSTGIVTNVFLRQNGEFEELDDELKQLMDNYINTGDESVFQGTNFKLDVITITNPPFCDYQTLSSDAFFYEDYYDNNDVILNKYDIRYKYHVIYPQDFKMKILTRIKYTPTEEIKYEIEKAIGKIDSISLKIESIAKMDFRSAEVRLYSTDYFFSSLREYFSLPKLDKENFHIIKNDLKKELEKQKKQIYDNIKEKQWIGLGEEHYYIGSWGFESKDGIMPVYSIHTEKKYHIDPNEVEQIENYLKGRKRQEEERKRQEELKRKKEEVENCLSKIYFFEGNGLNSITDDNVKSSYQKIRSEYVKERYDTITEQDIELLKEFVVFSNKIDDLSKNEMATFNQNNVEIRKVASLLCADALPIYEKEISIESKPFDDINGLNSIIDEYKNKIKMQEDFLKFAKKRQLINETENSLIEAISGNSVPLKGAMRIATGQDVADIATTVGDLSKEKKSGNKHLEKVYNEYKKSFDFSWSNNGDWAERLNTFADNQNKYLRCVSLLAEIESNDAKILEATKKLKRIKKAYSEYKETLNFETIPHSDDNKTLEEFVKFQTKVFQNINSKGEFVNDSLKKIKDLNEKKAILTR